jgi:hypothetical protein
MSKSSHETVEFDAVVDDQEKIAIPRHALRDLGSGVGKRVRVRLNRHDELLHRNAVTEEEVEQITRLQLEPREQVVKFLLAEGALRKQRRRLVAVLGAGKTV